MLNIKFFFLLALIFVLTKVTKAADSKLHITVLYESLCPDSKRFMRQLGPVYEEFKDYINVKLVPFGKAETSDSGGTVICQHGPRECEGNRLQDCVLSTTNDQTKQVRFVVCQMTRAASSSNIDECAREAELSPDIEECANTELGTELQLKSEYITNSYPHSFIPTIVYNGIFNQYKQDRSINNFRRILCDQLMRQKLLLPNDNRCQ